MILIEPPFFLSSLSQKSSLCYLYLLSSVFFSNYYLHLLIRFFTLSTPLKLVSPRTPSTAPLLSPLGDPRCSFTQSVGRISHYWFLPSGNTVCIWLQPYGFFLFFIGCPIFPFSDHPSLSDLHMLKCSRLSPWTSFTLFEFSFHRWHIHSWGFNTMYILLMPTFLSPAWIFLWTSDLHISFMLNIFTQLFNKLLKFNIGSWTLDFSLLPPFFPQCPS